MILVLDDIVRVGEWLVLRRKWIGGVKELIDSILHDWSVGRGSLSLSQNDLDREPLITCTTPSLSFQWTQNCMSPVLFFPLC